MFNEDCLLRMEILCYMLLLCIFLPIFVFDNICNIANKIPKPNDTLRYTNIELNWDKFIHESLLSP